MKTTRKTKVQQASVGFQRELVKLYREDRERYEA